jgi:hypothetical protein
MKTLLISILLSSLIFSNITAQSKLRPGFNPMEFRDLMQISVRQLDSITYPYPGMIASYPNYHMAYESPVVGLKNQWQLWISPDNIGIITIRATVPTEIESWMENLYSAMIPAEGSLKIEENKSFNYKLAEDSNAYVHAGWVIGLASMAPDIVEKINTYHKKGIKDFIIVGHSQGGAVAFLLRSYLYYMKPALPRDITIKSYHSAAPKPGNLYYAYDFNFITRDGWSYHVVNTEDWVPQLPLSLQTMQDINSSSPFAQEKELMKYIPFIERTYIKHIYNKLNKSTIKSQKLYTKYLGHKTYKYINDSIPSYEKPVFAKSYNYASCGVPITLRPSKNYWNNYYAKYKDKYSVFIHHHFYAYYLIVMEMYPERD